MELLRVVTCDPTLHWVWIQQASEDLVPPPCSVSHYFLYCRMSRFNFGCKMKEVDKSGFQHNYLYWDCTRTPTRCTNYYKLGSTPQYSKVALYLQSVFKTRYSYRVNYKPDLLWLLQYCLMSLLIMMRSSSCSKWHGLEYHTTRGPCRLISNCSDWNVSYITYVLNSS